MTLYRKTDSKHFLSHTLLTALFWGSLWGLTEATLGHILHLLRIPGLAGFVMFPLGVYFMLKAYKASDNVSIILSTSIVAATIKLSNIFLPGISPLDVFNPALAIICESLSVFVLFSFIKQKVHHRYLILGWLVMSWRVLFMTSLLMIESLFPSQSVISLGYGRLFSFFIWESIANGILIYPLMKNSELKTHTVLKLSFSPSLLTSCLLFIAALITEWMF